MACRKQRTLKVKTKVTDPQSRRDPTSAHRKNLLSRLLRNRKKKTGSDIHLVYILDNSAKLPSIDF